ncbi:MAG: hypothetical protein QXI58_04575 [Candidatus Micrarchaeia archaeon]
MLTERIILIDNGEILFDGKKEDFIKRFGVNRKRIFIDMEMLIKKEKLVKFFITENANVLELDEYKIVLEVNSDVKITELLKEIEKYGAIKDVHIERESLRDVIKRIYETKI